MLLETLPFGLSLKLLDGKLHWPIQLINNRVDFVLT
jgi:hypothetical protein